MSGWWDSEIVGFWLSAVGYQLSAAGSRLAGIPIFVSLTILTGILRLRLRMASGRKANPVTLSLKSSLKAIPSPFEPFEPTEPSEPEPRSGSKDDTTPLSGQRTLSKLRNFFTALLHSLPAIAGPNLRRSRAPSESTEPFGPMGQSKKRRRARRFHLRKR